ncbi:hypothetical protein VTO42DRAFT_7395 [Malbranchea cinnamomea]
MKFFSIAALSTLAVLAAAQETSAPTPSLSPEARCALECPEGDVCCQADCLRIPCPSHPMATDTTDCVAHCDQGEGSPEDTEAFARCVQQCIDTHFLPTNRPGATGSNGSDPTGTEAPEATGTGDNGDEGDGDDEDNSGSTGTATTTDGAEPTESNNAATALTISSSGILALIVAAFAL